MEFLWNSSVLGFVVQVDLGEKKYFFDGMQLGEGFFSTISRISGPQAFEVRSLEGFLLHPENPANMKPKPMGTARGKVTPHAIDLFLAKLRKSWFLKVRGILRIMNTNCFILLDQFEAYRRREKV